MRLKDGHRMTGENVFWITSKDDLEDTHDDFLRRPDRQ